MNHFSNPVDRGWLKMQDMKLQDMNLQDMKMEDQIAGREIAK